MVTMPPQQPLNWQASASATNAHTTNALPEPVQTCLKNARFLHLATCENDAPHVALMSYTYLTNTPYRPYPVIIMTTNPDSRKTLNIMANSRVSLLAHDWVSPRPPTARAAAEGRDTSPPPQVAANTSSLASLLFNLNSSALSRISATINGRAELLQPGDEEQWCKRVHLENNTFDEAGLARSTPAAQSGCFIEGEDVRVVLVRVVDGRIADWKGSVQDWSLS